MHEHGHEHGHNSPGKVEYEVNDVQIKMILIAGLATVILTLIAYIVGTVTVKIVRNQPAIGNYNPTPVAIEEQNKPWNLQTRLQVDPPRALVEFRAGQKEVENSYGVVSAEKPEIYRIPVETAMKIVAEKGLPKFPVVPAPAEAQ